MARGRWIQGAVKKPGALRAAAHVKKGRKIPMSTLRRLAKKKGVTGRRARLAITFRRLASHRRKS